MKRILTISLLTAVSVWANIQSGNEQGLAEGHSFTSTGPGERVSNLNGNLMLSIPLADVTSASPLGIHLERSFNSHWRDPLYAAPMDFVAKGGYQFRTSRRDEYRSIDHVASTSSFGGWLGEANNYQEYKAEQGTATSSSASLGLALATSVGSSGWQVANLIKPMTPDMGKSAPLDNAGTWASAGFAAASVTIQICSMKESGFSPTLTAEDLVKVTSLGVSSAQLVNVFVRNKVLGKQLAVAGFALHLYSAVKWSTEANPWDPGYEYNQYLIPFSLALDYAGTALLFTPAMPFGVALKVASALVDLTAMLITLQDAADDRLDFRVVRSCPWALSVNGYVGMIGDKKEEEQGVPAYPFGGYGTEEFIVAINPASMHPMPDMNLIRSGGGSDRYFLVAFDPSLVGADRWYTYASASKSNRTKVYFCDRPPFQNPATLPFSRKPMSVPDDPNDYYLVKEPDGTWAKFGLGATKGVQRHPTGWGDVFESYWALPNSVHHFGGDSISIQYDDSLQVTSVRHSKDPRWVRVTPATWTESVETIDGSGVAGSKVLIKWINDAWSTDRTSTIPGWRRRDSWTDSDFFERFQERFPKQVTVFPDGSRSLTTRFDWSMGNLVGIHYPDGASARYEYFDRNQRSPFDGFLKRRTQYASATVSFSPTTEHSFEYSGWSQGTPGGASGVLTTEVTTKVNAPVSSNSGLLSSTSSINRYQFQFSQGSVNVRESSVPMTAGVPDTTMASYTGRTVAKMRLRTVETGLEGHGKRTDFVYDEDRLLLTMERPGLDTVFAPKLTVNAYDSKGNLISRRTNPASEMANLERRTLLVLGNGIERWHADTNGFDWQAMRDSISRVLGTTWKSRFDTLDLMELFGTRSVDGSEMILDTTYTDRNPYKRLDSIRIVQRRDTLRIWRDTLSSYEADLACLKNRDSAKIQTTCAHSVAQLSYEDAKQKIAAYREFAVSMVARISDDSTRWVAQDSIVFLTFPKRNPSFNPYGKYVYLPALSVVARKNPDTTIGCGLVGSQTIYDSLLRPVRVDAWRNGPLPGVRYEYGDSKWPFVPTGTRAYTDSVGSQLRYRYSRVELDPTIGVPVRTHAWKGFFTEPKADTFGLPGKNPSSVTAAGTADFVQSMQYDSRGRPIRSIGPRGDTSEIRYDDLGRVVQSRSPGGKWVATRYSDVQDAKGIVWIEQDRESGAKDIQGVNGLGWPVISGSIGVGGRDSVIAYQGFQVHGPSWSQDAEGRIVRSQYDAQGRVIRTVVERGNGLLDIWETEYDDFERTAVSIDPLGRKSTTWFDVMGRPLRTIRQLDATRSLETKSKYDNLGNLVWTQAPGGDTTHYEYTLANQLQYSVNSDQFKTRSAYDWSGNLLRSSRTGSGTGRFGDGGDSSSLVYDGLGRLVSATVDNDPRMSQTLIYDANGSVTDKGMLLGVRRGTGAVSALQYDVRGSLTQKALQAGIFEGIKSSQNPSDTLGWEYLADGRPKLQRLPRGARIEYVWDALDRLAKVRFVDPKGVARSVVDTLLYRKTGALDSIRLGNGVGQKFAYDSARGMLTSEHVIGKAGQIFGNRRDHYDNAARLVERTRMDGQRVDFGYDALDRLNAVRYGTGNQAGTSNLTYAWDDNGSMTRFAHDYGRTDWTQVGSTGRVATSVGAQDGKSDWGYDWAGRLGYRKWVSALSDTATRELRQYRWNGAEELERFTRLQAASGTTTKTTDQFGFAYGDHGLRVGKYRGTPNGSDTVWAQERRSVWDGPDVVADSTAGDSTWRYRVVLGLNATAEAKRDSTGTWRLTYQVNDPVGTPEFLLDDSGKVVATYAHDPFGNLEDYQGSRETEFRFGGREWDPDLQAGVFGYRLYDPEMGGFLTHDPMGQFNNPYSYVGADPLAGVDPWGLEGSGSGTPDNPMDLGSANISPFHRSGTDNTTVVIQPVALPQPNRPSLGLPAGQVSKIPDLAEPMEGEAGNVLVGAANIWQNARRKHQLAILEYGQLGALPTASWESLKIGLYAGPVMRSVAGAARASWGASGLKFASAASSEPATVEQLVGMMNKRPGVFAKIAEGDELAYLEYSGAEASHMYAGAGQSSILLRPTASRWGAYHEWVHKILQSKVDRAPAFPGEDDFIEAFLARHQKLFNISKPLP